MSIRILKILNNYKQLCSYKGLFISTDKGTYKLLEYNGIENMVGLLAVLKCSACRTIMLVLISGKYKTKLRIH